MDTTFEHPYISLSGQEWMQYAKSISQYFDQQIPESFSKSTMATFGLI